MPTKLAELEIEKFFLELLIPSVLMGVTGYVLGGKTVFCLKGRYTIKFH